MAKAATNVVQGSGTNGWIMKRERSVWSAQATEIGRLREIACSCSLPTFLIICSQLDKASDDGLI